MLKYQGMTVPFLGVVMLLVFWLPACGGGSEEEAPESDDGEAVEVTVEEVASEVTPVSEAEEVEMVTSVEEEPESRDEEYSLVIKSEAGPLKELFDQDARYGHVSLRWVGGWLVKDGVVQTEAKISHIHHLGFGNTIRFITSCEVKERWEEGDIDVFSATLGVDEAGSVVMNIPKDKLNPENKEEMTELLGRGSYGPEQVNETFTDIFDQVVSTKTFNGCFKFLYANQKDTFYTVGIPETSILAVGEPREGVVVDEDVEMARELLDWQLSTEDEAPTIYSGKNLPWTYDKKISQYKTNEGKVFPGLLISVGHWEEKDHRVTVELNGGGLRYFLQQLDPAFADIMKDQKADRTSYERAMSELIAALEEKLPQEQEEESTGVSWAALYGGLCKCFLKGSAFFLGLVYS